mmetsp:Transcript_525/g.1921  ORF Transcript_525/g.1921 Transcript_525/m.1921 type:complete len:221 (-) Transcript_525:16-678(-)
MELRAHLAPRAAPLHVRQTRLLVQVEALLLRVLLLHLGPLLLFLIAHLGGLERVLRRPLPLLPRQVDPVDDVAREDAVPVLHEALEFREQRRVVPRHRVARDVEHVQREDVAEGLRLVLGEFVEQVPVAQLAVAAARHDAAEDDAGDHLLARHARADVVRHLGKLRQRLAPRLLEAAQARAESGEARGRVGVDFLWRCEVLFAATLHRRWVRASSGAGTQ